MLHKMPRLLSLVPVACAFGAPALAQEAETCDGIRLADVGWTDLAFTNAAAIHILELLGYETNVDVLGLGVIYASLERGDLDAFLGYWPIAQVEFEPYFESGAVEELGMNLEGTRFTLAVPDYVAEAGVTSFSDLTDHSEHFESRIYGIEPGANQYLLEMVAEGHYGLDDWTVVESSEQGMLAQVERAIERDEWVVFLGWEPHPMNRNIEMTYLAGGDEVFGPDYGSDSVRTVARTGFADECPNLGRFLSNLRFTIDVENAGMSFILNEGMTAEDAAVELLRQNPDLVSDWLDGVEARDGTPAQAVVARELG